MAKFMFVFRGGGIVEKGLAPADLGAHLEKWKAWVGDLTKKGQVETYGEPLQSVGKVVRGKGKTVIDGTFAEAKDMVTGTLFVVADSLDAATQIALGCPIYEFDGSVEVRPVYPRG
ncbi:MAG TPA: YciI family protein [Polyangiaceae bacterium]|jgi:hypothetical protein|nr:YciI family protein [Polyangiaceae bacterium]